MASPISFVKSHPWFAVASVVSLGLNVYGNLSSVYDLWTAGLPIWVWQSAGAVLFFSSSVVLLYGFWAKQEDASSGQITSPLPAKPPFAGAPRKQIAPPFTGPYEGAHKALLLFVVDHLVDTVIAMFSYELSIASTLSDQSIARSLIQEGIRRRQQSHALGVALDGLKVLLADPIPNMGQAEMEKLVSTVKAEYPRYQSSLSDFEQQIYAQTGLNPHFDGAWQYWRNTHTEMVTAYEAIRREPALATLFSPARPVLWEPLAKPSLFA